jgi:histidyl-tRNA synthetase
MTLRQLCAKAPISIIDTRVVSGTRDILPALAIQRNWVVAQFRSIFERYGFVPIDTPTLERREVLYGKGGGEEVQRQVFEVAARGQKLEESELALRFDLTVPLARFMARHVDELGVPFKRYHIGLVYRGERAQRGRFREFYQCDFDTIGSRSPLSDAEIGLVIHDGLVAVGVPAFNLRVNHRKILIGMLDSLSLNEHSGHVLRSLDKYAKIGRDAVLHELQFGESSRSAGHAERLDEEEGNADSVTSSSPDVAVGERILELDQARRIMDFVESAQSGRPSDVLSDVEKQIGSNATAREGIDNLRTVCELMTAGGVAEERIVVQVGLARGLDYYTGVIFESMVIGHEKIGSVCSGGRYDDLAGLFTERQLPGVGASFGLDRLMELMADAGWLKSSGTIAPVLLVNFQASDMPHYLRIARELREAGIACEVFPESKRLGEQFGYASSRGHRFAVIAGPDELAANVFALRDMTTRQQQKNLPRGKLTELVKEALGNKS